jgi:hypothetical protein
MPQSWIGVPSEEDASSANSTCSVLLKIQISADLSSVCLAAARSRHCTTSSRAKWFLGPVLCQQTFCCRLRPVRDSSGVSSYSDPASCFLLRPGLSKLSTYNLLAAYGGKIGERRLRSRRTASNVSSRKRMGSRSPALAKVTRWLATTCAAGSLRSANPKSFNAPSNASTRIAPSTVRYLFFSVVDY